MVWTGCHGSADEERGRVAARLEAIEKRLTALEQRVETVGAVKGAVEELERRLAGVTAARAGQEPAAGAANPGVPPGQLATPAERPARSAAHAWAGFHGPGGEQRRAALMALGDEHKDRAAKVQEQHEGAQDAAGR